MDADLSSGAPPSPDVLVRQSAALREIGRLTDAEALVGRALALDPDFADGYVELARIRRADGRFGDAEAAARRALAIDERLVEGRMVLIEVLLRMLETPEDAAIVEREIADLVDRLPGHPVPIYYGVESAAQQRLWNVVDDRLRMLDAVAPASRQAVVGRARACQLRGMASGGRTRGRLLRESEHWWRELLARQPEDAYARSQLAEVHALLGRHRDALDHHVERAARGETVDHGRLAELGAQVGDKNDGFGILGAAAAFVAAAMVAPVNLTLGVGLAAALMIAGFCVSMWRRRQALAGLPDAVVRPARRGRAVGRLLLSGGGALLFLFTLVAGPTDEASVREELEREARRRSISIPRMTVVDGVPRPDGTTIDIPAVSDAEVQAELDGELGAYGWFVAVGLATAVFAPVHARRLWLDREPR